MAIVAAVAAVAAVLLVPSEPSRSSAPAVRSAGTKPRTPVSSSTTDSRPVREDCSTRSGATFRGAFTDPRNLVVGPLVLIGGAYTPASTVRKFGGNKFPLLVKAGHTVTVRLPPSARAVAGLAYGPLPQGRQVTVRDAHQAVTFVACRPGGPADSSADAIAVTFWSGGVAARAPACVALEVYVDREPSPRHVGLPLGRRCGR
jgi:hypothetical protein